MAQDYQALLIADQGYIDYTPGSDVEAGEVVVQSGLLGIATVPISSGDLGALATRGVFDVVKVNGALTVGAVVYWDEDGNPQGGTAGTGGATSTSTDNTPLGRVLVAAGITDEVVRVQLFDAPSVTNTTTSVGPATNEIDDPGDGEAIPVAASGTIMLVSADAETRTLADPSFVGQELTLTMLTDGGDIVITAASPVNQTGNDTLTFGAVRDTIKLVAIEATASNEWQIAYNDGVALSTG